MKLSIKIMSPETPTSSSPPASRFNLKPYLLLAPAVLLLMAAAAFGGWWYGSNAQSSERTVSVTGNATVKAEPDQFTFYPSYGFKNADKQAALAAMTAKSEQIIAELKKLGVADSKIKTNASGYERGIYLPAAEGDGITYTLSLTVVAENKELAQKVQDYLVNTSPTGAVTPQPTFSQSKQKQLESEARSKAERDARAKAEASAGNLGYKIGKVKSISEATGFSIMPTDVSVQGAEPAAKRLSIQPGENEFPYSVTVVYYIR